MMKINIQKTIIMVLVAVVISLSLVFTPLTPTSTHSKVVNAGTITNSSVDEIVSSPQYNSRDQNIVTSPLDQGSTNICWAYATASASETSILKDKLDSNTSNTLRFSPTQIAYRTFNRDADPLNNTIGVYESDKWNEKGSPANTFLMLSQWCGPTSFNTPIKSDAYENSLYRLLDAETIDSNLAGEYRIKEIKKAIAKYGAVTGSYYNARETMYYNTKGETLDGISHAITIIGWDDTIPADNFLPKNASQNGGWIIKNSYNSCPYFYLSYDSSIGNVCGFKYAPKTDYDFNYFYDNVTDEPMRSENNSKNVANVFMAKNGSASYTEYVKAINVATYGNNLICNVKVYTNLTDSANPESGTLSATGTRTLEYSGYHTITLDNMAKIDKNTYYSVVVSISSTTGGSAYILYALNTSNNTRYKSASGWNKANYASRIKAYTVLQPETKTDISTASHNPIEPKPYTGSEICPDVEIFAQNTTLIKNVDYTISYSSNINIGTGVIIVSGINNYFGTLSINFKILPIEVPVKPPTTLSVSASATTLNDIPLPINWVWLNPDLRLADITEATAIYIGADKDNYTNTSITITLQNNNDSTNSGTQDSTSDTTSNNKKTPHNNGVIYIILSVCGVTAITGTAIALYILRKKKTKDGKN